MSSSASSCGSCGTCGSPSHSNSSHLIEQSNTGTGAEDEWTDISGEVSSLLYDHKQLLAIERLLLDTLELWSHSIHDAADEQDSDSAFFHSFESAFHQISNSFAGASGSALRVLVALFDHLGAKRFLECCIELLHANMYSHLLSWAFQYVKEDANRLAQIFTAFDKHIQFSTPCFASENDWKKERQTLVDFANKEAAIYECFPQHGKLPRATAQNQWWKDIVDGNTDTATHKEKLEVKPDEVKQTEEMRGKIVEEPTVQKKSVEPVTAAAVSSELCGPSESTATSSSNAFSLSSSCTSSSTTSSACLAMEACSELSDALFEKIATDMVDSILPPRSLLPVSWRFLDACVLSVAVALPVVAVYIAVSGVFSQ